MSIHPQIQNPYITDTFSSKTVTLFSDLRKKGFLGFIFSRIEKRIINPLLFFLFKQWEPHRFFSWNNRTYSYFSHWYNFTFKNERAVEIPIFSHALKRYKSTQILEIGNVLSHYIPVNHIVVDKYEIAPKVVNDDVVTYNSKRKFDLIIAVSTLEHVGWHEEPYQKNKSLHAMLHLQTLLSAKGKLLFSVPMGINNDLDRLIKNKKLPLNSSWFLKRTSGWTNKWVEVDFENVKNIRYNTPFPNANAIMIGEIRKNTTIS